MDEVLRGFACPQEPLDDSLIGQIAGEYAAAYTARFLDEHEAVLDGRAPGLSAVARRWIESPIPFDEAWDPALGRARSAVLGHRIDPVDAAAALGLHLAAHGHAGDWDIALASPRRLRWGEQLLPPADRLTMQPSPAGPQLALFAKDLPVADSAAQPIPWFEIAGRRAMVLAGDAADDAALPHGSDTLTPAATGDVVDACRRGVAVLAAHAPDYLPWVARVLRAVVPVDGSDGIMRSSSDDDLPGVVRISFPHAAVQIAEMLVHESSHQVYHIAARLGEVHDGSDTTLYHSPVKQTGRPVDKILLAYHAFANVLMFYRACVASGLDDGGYCAQNIARHEPELDLLRGHLDAATSLTDIGCALWRPLAERVA